MLQSHWVLAEGRAQRMLDVNRDVDYVISHLVQHTCIFSLKFTHTHTPVSKITPVRTLPEPITPLRLWITCLVTQEQRKKPDTVTTYGGFGAEKHRHFLTF